MALKSYDSPFHVTHNKEQASKMAMKVDLSIMISHLIKEQGWTQSEAAQRLSVQQSRISELANAKIEKFTIDAMFDMLDSLGFQARMSMSSLQEALDCYFKKPSSLTHYSCVHNSEGIDILGYYYPMDSTKT